MANTTPVKTPPNAEPFLWLQEYESFADADCGCILESQGPNGEPGAAVYLCETHEKATSLTSSDWEEIYYALEYKMTSPAVKGSDREARDWRAHLKRILRTIGPDGKNMKAIA